jgi:hypothetical protein
VSTHFPSHSNVLPVQLAAQAPFEHSWPAIQALPHEPQLWESDWVSTHFPPHVVWGGTHVPLPPSFAPVPPEPPLAVAPPLSAEQPAKLSVSSKVEISAK